MPFNQRQKSAARRWWFLIPLPAAWLILFCVALFHASRSLGEAAARATFVFLLPFGRPGLAPDGMDFLVVPVYIAVVCVGLSIAGLVKPSQATLVGLSGLLFLYVSAGMFVLSHWPIAG
jgi:hypothetical protein